MSPQHDLLQQSLRTIRIILGIAAFAAVLLLLFSIGHGDFSKDLPLLQSVDSLILVLLFTELALLFWQSESILAFLRRSPLGLTLFLGWFFLYLLESFPGLFVGLQQLPAHTTFLVSIVFRLLLLILKLLTLLVVLRDFLTGISRNPALTLVMGFAMTIFAGALFLTLPVSLAGDKSFSFLDALFTATSAVCVTGLIVVDTGTHFSLFGEIIILVLIQAGGLGIMTLAVFIGLFLKEKLSLQERQHTQTILDQSNATAIFPLIRRIIRITLLIELIGALLLFFYHRVFTGPDFANFGEEAFYCIFHSVSAFCNAGFSLNADSLSYLSGNLLGNFLFIFLIISGGLGFSVIINLGQQVKRLFSSASGQQKTLTSPKKAFVNPLSRVTLQTKIILLMTILLLVGGTLLFYAGEHNHFLAGYGPAESFSIALFQSTTTRTAGFNTIPIGSLQPVTLVIMLGLMLIGASPGSTGGGLKTTTVFILFKSLLSIIREDKNTRAFKRSIPMDIINKSLAIFLLFISLVFLATIAILFAETGFTFLEILFEVVSAAATVGLSTGITAGLAEISKLIIIITMFLGRVGPLTLVMAMTLRRQRDRFLSYPKERIMVG